MSLVVLSKIRILFSSILFLLLRERAGGVCGFLMGPQCVPQGKAVFATSERNQIEDLLEVHVITILDKQGIGYKVILHTGVNLNYISTLSTNI